MRGGTSSRKRNGAALSAAQPDSPHIVVWGYAKSCRVRRDAINCLILLTGLFRAEGSQQTMNFLFGRQIGVAELLLRIV